MQEKTENPHVFIDYLKTRQKTWEKKNLTFGEFVLEYSRGQRPFQMSLSTLEHPDKMQWEEGSSQKKDYLKQFKSDLKDLKKHLKKSKLKFPFIDSPENKELIENIATKLRAISAPLHSQLTEMGELGSENKKQVIEDLCKAYIFSLTSEIYTKTKKQVVVRSNDTLLIDQIRKVMFDEKVYDAFNNVFKASASSRSFKYTEFTIPYSFNPERALKMLEEQVDENNLFAWCFQLAKDDHLNQKQTKEIVSRLCKIASQIGDEERQKKYIDILTTEAEKHGFGCNFSKNKIELTINNYKDKVGKPASLEKEADEIEAVEKEAVKPGKTDVTPPKVTINEQSVKAAKLKASGDHSLMGGFKMLSSKKSTSLKRSTGKSATPPYIGGVNQGLFGKNNIERNKITKEKKTEAKESAADQNENTGQSIPRKE